MVRFAPVISSAAVARSQANNLQVTRVATNREFPVTASAQQKRPPAKLPSLYPAISLKSLRSRELESQIYRDTPEVSSHNTTGSVDASQQSAEPKVKGTSLVVGAAGILRAAAAVAVNNATAKITVHQAEEQIQEPECEVNNYRMGAF